MIIDLHTHTTASDGRCTPEELVARAAGAGVRVLAVTDHDTMAACGAVQAACARHGLEFVSGIEVTAVDSERDVHTLGYFLDIDHAPFQTFLTEQRQNRVSRIREMVERLAAHGIRLDVDRILGPGLEDASRSVGRPWIARELVAQGHVKDVGEAFDCWLSPGKPGFVPRIGATPQDVIARIHDAGGIASLAHPGTLARDHWIPAYVEAGLDALEVFHSDHDAAATAKYRTMAEAHGLAMSGGSDYHADDAHGGGSPGRVSLPGPQFEQLKALAHRSR